jgi:tRNA pseudouridine38-40 synthase
MSGRRWRLDLAYEGSGFAGWQVQPGKRTVQGEVERTLARLGERVRPVGAGRTDAGVHALGLPAHVDLERDWAPRDLERGLRSLLPPDVSLLALHPVGEDFHARYSAQSRTYHYALGLAHNPFFFSRRWSPGTIPAAAWADTALAPLAGERDVASLAKAGGDSRTTRSRILGAWWRPFPGGAVLGIVADRFLYGMVRAVVGTLVRAHQRGEDPACLEEVLAAGDRGAAGEAAPPQGLYLAGVSYPGDAPGTDRAEDVAALAGIDREPEDEPGREGPNG